MSLEGMLYDMQVSQLRNGYVEAINDYNAALREQRQITSEWQETFVLAALRRRKLGQELSKYDSGYPLFRDEAVAIWNDSVREVWKNAGRPLSSAELDVLFKQVQNLPLPPRVGPPPPDVGAIQSSLAASSAEFARLKAALAARDQSGNGEVERLKQENARLQKEAQAARSELARVKSDLSDVRGIMLSTSRQYETTAVELSQVRAELSQAREKLASTAQQLHEAAHVAAQMETDLRDEVESMRTERKKAEVTLNSTNCDLADHMLQRLVYREELSKVCPDHPLFTSKVYKQNMECLGRMTYILERNWGAVRTAASELMAKSAQEEVDLERRRRATYSADPDAAVPGQLDFPDFPQDWQDGAITQPD